MKVSIINRLVRALIFTILALFIGFAHYMNANPHCEKLDTGQVFEQVEALLNHRKNNKKIGNNFVIKFAPYEKMEDKLSN